jgi:hypothetical protein
MSLSQQLREYANSLGLIRTVNELSESVTVFPNLYHVSIIPTPEGNVGISCFDFNAYMHWSVFPNDNGVKKCSTFDEGKNAIDEIFSLPTFNGRYDQ